jgi:hypothetical protein
MSSLASHGRVASALALAASALVLTATAHAAPIAGSVEDDAGDGDGAPGDIRIAVLVYDPAGWLRGAFSFAELPTASGIAGADIGVGTWVKKTGQCLEDADANIYPPEPDIPEWFGALYFGRQAGPEATVSASGSVVSFEIPTDQALAGKPWNCARAETFGPDVDPKTDDYRDRDDTTVFSLTAQEAQQPTAPPKCDVPAQRVRRGRNARLRCSNLSGRLTVRFYRGLKLKMTRRARIAASGRVKVSTRGLPRGRYAMFAWSGDVVPGYTENVRIR